MIERATLERAVVDREDPSAAFGRAIAPAAGRSAEIAYDFTVCRFAARHDVRFLDFQIAARRREVIVGHATLPAGNRFTRSERVSEVREYNKQSSNRASSARQFARREPRHTR